MGFIIILLVVAVIYLYVKSKGGVRRKYTGKTKFQKNYERNYSRKKRLKSELETKSEINENMDKMMHVLDLMDFNLSDNLTPPFKDMAQSIYEKHEQYGLNMAKPLKEYLEIMAFAASMFCIRYSRENRLNEKSADKVLYTFATGIMANLRQKVDLNGKDYLLYETLKDRYLYYKQQTVGLGKEQLYQTACKIFIVIFDYEKMSPDINKLGEIKSYIRNNECRIDDNRLEFAGFVLQKARTAVETAVNNDKLSNVLTG